ncbi:MAG: hypothetical protein ABJP70_09860 [Erythrobacter sp.]
MSQSSNALFSNVFGGFFRVSMRYAAPILFWAALAVFALTVAAYSSSSIIQSDNDQTDSATHAFIIFNGVVLGLNNAVWPFTGAALVSVLSKREGVSDQ